MNQTLYAGEVRPAFTPQSTFVTKKVNTSTIKRLKTRKANIRRYNAIRLFGREYIAIIPLLVVINALILVYAQFGEFTREMEEYTIQGVNVALAKDNEEIRGIEPTVEDVKNEIIAQSKIFGVNTDLALAIAFCESGFRWNARNTQSTARGVYQYIAGTWAGTESDKQGLDRYNYKANIREAMIDMANGEAAHQWRDCYNKVK